MISYGGFIGETIIGITIDDDYCSLMFLAGNLVLKDEGQSCCERRYMRTDDKPTDLVGKQLRSIEEKDAPDLSDGGYDVHEVTFLVVTTTDGDSVSFSFHNEHNGYYGGFNLKIEEQRT